MIDKEIQKIVGKAVVATEAMVPLIKVIPSDKRRWFHEELAKAREAMENIDVLVQKDGLKVYEARKREEKEIC